MTQLANSAIDMVHRRTDPFFPEGGDDALVSVEALEAQPEVKARSCAWSLISEMTQCRSQSFGAHSLAGMMNTSTCVLHVTDREGRHQTSTCEPHVTDREGLCGGVSSGSEERMEPRRRRDEGIDTVLVLSVLLVWRGFRGICRNHATVSML